MPRDYDTPFGGMSLAKVAQEMGIKKSMVRRLEASALSKVKRQIERHYPDLKFLLEDNNKKSNYDDNIYFGE